VTVRRLGMMGQTPDRAGPGRLHAAEQALMSDDAQVRDAAIREAGEIVRAAHNAVTGE
jgi:hypothetical protein